MLQKHVTQDIMVIGIEFKIFDQIVQSASTFWQKVNCLNFEDDCVPKGFTGKLASWGGEGGGSYLFIKYDVFRQKCRLPLKNIV